MELKKKIQLAKWMCDNNPNLTLTGSLMLYLRGVNLGREPHDIDLVISSRYTDEPIIVPPFITEVDVINDSGYSVLKRFMYEDVKVEIIADYNIDVPYTYIDITEYLDISIEKCLDEGVIKGYATKIPVAYITRLLSAKDSYLTDDDYQEYVEKTKIDIDIIKKFLDEHKEIVEYETKKHDMFDFDFDFESV